MTLNFAIFHHLTRDYVCPKCASREAYTQFILNNTSETVVICCKDCGFDEFYDYNVLDKNILK